MRFPDFRKARLGLTFEWTIAVITIGALIYSFIFLLNNNYLPQPFFYEPEDSFADWFNTAYWSRDLGTYDVWTSIYPPLSFVFLRFFGNDQCYLTVQPLDTSVGYPARDCDWLGHVCIWGLFLINTVLIYKIFRRNDKTTAIPRTICLALGWPMLDGLERGNLVLVSFACFVLAFGPLVRTARLRWLFAGLAVNFKVYLIAAIVPLLLKRRWRWVECAIISVVLVYIFSYMILGRGTPMEIYRNLSDWANIQNGQPLDLWFSTTYNALLALLKNEDFPTVLIIGSGNIDLLEIVVPALQHFTQALILLAAGLTWLRPERISSNRVVMLGVLMALVTSEAGGYSPVYYMFFMLLEPWRGFGRKWAIIGCYLMAPALDIAIDQIAPVVRNTYFRHSVTIVSFDLTLWPFIRPLLIETMAWAIACTTIREAWQDIRLQGWAKRWRFRNDTPLLPGVEHPVPVSGSG